MYHIVLPRPFFPLALKFSFHIQNIMRQAIYPEHYITEAIKSSRDLQVHIGMFQLADSVLPGPDRFDIISFLIALHHTEHCIDHVRQSVMCHSDASPVHFFYHPVYGRPMPEFETVHTCRNFSSLRSWSISKRVLETSRKNL